MTKTYNTPKRNHVVKTRLNDDEYDFFLHRLDAYGMNQSAFIRKAISGATIRPVIVASLVNDELLAAIGKLTAEYGRIGNNLNQIARHLNEWQAPYPDLAKELRDAAVDLATLKYDVMKKVGDTLGNVQTYKLKNADYSAAEAYLTFEHDEFTMKASRDENGRLIPRRDYRIVTLNCGEEDFAVACMRANLRYGKNQKREDVKSHHYIISFDPKDTDDHGLTVDAAQKLGETFCANHFPGHQAIVCTHPDGHNGSGNIHVHIVINSLRIAEVPFLPYMDRPCDTQPGMKHRCTDAAMEYFRAEVMEMCHNAGLYQIDLLNGSKTRVTEREYWAKKKGQRALDTANAAFAEKGLPIRQTKFETDKDKLREEIRKALADAVSFEDFAGKLLRRGITVKESRGRLSYLTSERTKPITARKLGDDFDKAAIFAVLDQNAKQPRLKSPPSIREFLQQRNKFSRMVDVEAKKAEGKGQGYVNWAKKHNLKNMSKALVLYGEYGFSSPEELEAACKDANRQRSDALAALKDAENAIREKKELQRHVLNFVKSKPLREGLKACKSDKASRAYQQEHASEFAILDAAKRFFDARGMKKLPSHKALQQEIEQLIKEKNQRYNEYQAAKQRADELNTIRYNLEQTLNGKRSQQPER